MVLELHASMKKIILVTGGSRGIGAATARLAAQRGYAVCINYLRNQAAANSVLQDIVAAGGTAIAVPGNVSSELDVIRLFKTVDDLLGPVTALVNNVGVVEQQTRVENMDAARLNRVLAVNVTGSFLCAREAIRRMSTKRGGEGGAIVNVSSVAARLGSPEEYVDYAAAKAAIDTFTVGLAKEVALEGIRVNAVLPGLVDTPIINKTGDGTKPADWLVAALEVVPPLKPEEVAQAVLELIVDDDAYSQLKPVMAGL